MSDASYDFQQTVYIDRVKGRIRRNFRSSMWNSSTNQLNPSVGYEIFDGQQYARIKPHADNTSDLYKPSENNPEMYLYTSANREFLDHLLTPTNLPIYYSLGFVFPYRQRSELRSLTALRAKHDSFLWRKPRGGEMELLLTGKGPRLSEELRVRPDWQGAVTSLKVHHDDQPFFSMEIEYDQSSTPRMPTTWAYTSYVPGSFTKCRLQSYEFETALDDELFRIPFEGMKIIVKDRRYYQVNPDGTLVLHPRNFRPDGQLR
jgi:hypothetical protein